MSDQLLHLFFADGETKTDADEPNLIWKPVLRTGTWRLRPGPGGVKLKAPLHVHRDKAPSGHISMAAIKEAFDAKAKEFVTVPQVHADGTTSDGGFVHKLAIEDVKDPETGKVTESKLWAGMEITDSELKRKITEKSIRGVSGGILFGYERTEDGKKFPQVMSHVMITNSPWINGTGDFTDKLPEGVMASEDDDLPVGELEQIEETDTALSDEFDDTFKSKLRRFLGLDPQPMAADKAAAEAAKKNMPDPQLDDSSKSKGDVIWRPEEGFRTVQGRVQCALKEFRRSMMTNVPTSASLSMDYPYYHCDDVSGSGDTRKALIRSGYGDESEAWVATIKLTADGVEIEPFKEWTPVKQEWVAASQDKKDHPTFPSPASARPVVRTSAAISQSLEDVGLWEAQSIRAERIVLGETRNTTNPGGPMSKKIMDILGGVELSDEQREAIRQEEERYAALESKAEADARAAREHQANTYLSELAKKLGINAPEGENDPAKGLDPSLARYVKGIMMSDDGGAAINLSFEAEGGARTQPVQKTASDVMKGFIDALPTDDQGRVTLSQQARALPGDSGHPADHKVQDAGKPEGEGKELSAKEKADQMAAQFLSDGLTGAELFATSTNGVN